MFLFTYCNSINKNILSIPSTFNLQINLLSAVAGCIHVTLPLGNINGTQLCEEHGLCVAKTNLTQYYHAFNINLNFRTEFEFHLMKYKNQGICFNNTSVCFIMI